MVDERSQRVAPDRRVLLGARQKSTANAEDEILPVIGCAILCYFGFPFPAPLCRSEKTNPINDVARLIKKMDNNEQWAASKTATPTAMCQHQENAETNVFSLFQSPI
mgnify:CR=1 FL=1